MTKRFGMSRKDYSGSVLKLLSLLFPTLLILGTGCSHIEPYVPPEGIEEITKERTEAEHSVRRLKYGYAKDTNEYKDGGGLYNKAEAAFNAWIEQIKGGLYVGSDMENKDQYKKSLREAAEKSKNFKEYVAELIRTKGRAPTIAPLPFNTLIQGLIEIWKEHREAKKERREEIIKYLDQLKWKSFDEIKVDNKNIE